MQADGDGDLTDAGSVIGTAGYLSPEQARGVSVDPRSDLYSFGVVLFEMLAGRRPFVGPSPLAILHQHIDDAPPSIRDLRPSASVELEILIGELLSKSPDDRPATARILADRLETIRDADRQVPRPQADQADVTRAMAPDAAEAHTQGDDRLAPTAVMPSAVRPDAGRVAVPAPVAPGPARGSRSGWPVVIGAIVVAGVVALLLVASQVIGDDDGEPEQTPDTSPTETTAPPPPTGTVDDVVAVPDVRGASQAEAEATIDDLGLTPIIETEELDDGDDQVGRVVAQSPDPDQQLNAGGEVRIVVGVAAQATTTTTASTTTQSSTTTTVAPTTTGAPTTNEGSTSTAPDG